MEHSRQPLPLRILRYLLAFALIGLCVSFIWYNSFQPPAVSAEFSRRVAAILGSVSGRIFGAHSGITAFLQENVRKIAHAVEFAALGGTSILTLWILGWVNGHTVVHAASFVLFVAVADETIQIFTGRGSSVADVVLDFAGGVGGILLMLILYAVVRRIFRLFRP